PVTEYAVAAAQEALDMAALAGVDAARIGAVIGIGVCGIETIDAAYRELYAGGGRVDPFAIPRIMPSAPASGLSMSLGIRGPAFCATSACASASHAIMTGALWL